MVNIQQAAANKMTFSSTWYFSLKNQPTKKQKIGEKNWRSCYRCTWYTCSIKDALDNHEQTGGGAGCKMPRQRGTDASFTCVLLRSCRDVRRPQHLPNAKNCRYFSTWFRWDHEKQISYFGDPQTGEVHVLTSGRLLCNIIFVIEKGRKLDFPPAKNPTTSLFDVPS